MESAPSVKRFDFKPAGRMLMCDNALVLGLSPL